MIGGGQLIGGNFGRIGITVDKRLIILAVYFKRHAADLLAFLHTGYRTGNTVAALGALCLSEDVVAGNDIDRNADFRSL